MKIFGQKGTVAKQLNRHIFINKFNQIRAICYANLYLFCLWLLLSQSLHKQMYQEYYPLIQHGHWQIVLISSQ
ncbi:MAG TPA: hypothetical protein DCG69_08205, partial [Bacteroidales bacterium]|nr:hypothetical protein [Bacteroidales bacterium]